MIQLTMERCVLDVYSIRDNIPNTEILRRTVAQMSSRELRRLSAIRLDKGRGCTLTGSTDDIESMESKKMQTEKNINKW